MHTNEVPSSILIRYRFTNKRRSRTMKTISLFKLARSFDFRNVNREDGFH